MCCSASVAGHGDRTRGAVVHIGIHDVTWRARGRVEQTFDAGILVVFLHVNFPLRAKQEPHVRWDVLAGENQAPDRRSMASRQPLR